MCMHVCVCVCLRMCVRVLAHYSFGLCAPSLCFSVSGLVCISSRDVWIICMFLDDRFNASSTKSAVSLQTVVYALLYMARSTSHACFVVNIAKRFVPVLSWCQFVMLCTACIYCLLSAPAAWRLHDVRRLSPHYVVFQSCCIIIECLLDVQRKAATAEHSHHIHDDPAMSIRAELFLLQLLCEGHNFKLQVLCFQKKLDRVPVGLPSLH